MWMRTSGVTSATVVINNVRGVCGGPLGCQQAIRAILPQGSRDWFPDNVLQIGVNRETGYGGLVWSASQGRAGKDYVSEYIWVTDNPSPPDFDPRVVSDPRVPYFFDPRSVLPLDQILAALEEFCSLETGDRPECVQWVHGT
jgi:hypothetical protein